MGLETLNATGTEWIASEGVLHITSPHALAQVIGYLKYTGGNSNARILFRGQSNVYGTMLPSAYRQSKHISTIKKEKVDDEIRKYLAECRASKSFLNGTAESSHEPLLQHYGLRTRWLDVVDNVWVALWFASYNIIADGVSRQYWSIERRSLSGSSGFVYIILFSFENASEHTSLPGHIRGANYRIVDLRVAAPSLYFRPHAQHGLLFRRSGPPSANWTDLSDLIAGTVRIGLADALDWLGSGELLTAKTLFPSPIYDFGYRMLLEKAPPGNYWVCSVAHVGP